MRLKDIDLNLLTVFDAIMADRSVSRAAERLGVTQSAVSHALARLRELTGDELFVRSQGGMVPTPEATALAGPLRSAVDLVQIAFSRRYRQEAETEERTFVLDLPIGIDVILIPHLIAASESIGLSAQFRVICENIETVMMGLRDGDTDISLDYQQPHQRSLVCQFLYRDEFMVCARKDHPDLVNGLSPELYLKLGHVSVNWARSPHSSPIDERLNSINIKRRVLVSLPTLAGCAAVVASTSLLFTIHSRVAALIASRFDLQVLPMPIPVANLTMYMIWHERSRSDSGHRWLRRSLKQVAVRLNGATDL